MLTIQIKPLEDDMDGLHPHSPITITLSGSDGKSASGQLLWGLWDLTGLADALKRFSQDPRAKKMIFESTEKPFQIICERRKHSTVIVFANGREVAALKETEAYTVFGNAFIQFHTDYFHSMARTDGTFDEAIQDTLTTFDEQCRTFGTT